jgi:hypothetical protein
MFLGISGTWDWPICTMGGLNKSGSEGPSKSSKRIVSDLLTSIRAESFYYEIVGPFTLFLPWVAESSSGGVVEDRLEPLCWTPPKRRSFALGRTPR